MDPPVSAPPRKGGNCANGSIQSITGGKTGRAAGLVRKGAGGKERPGLKKLPKA